MKDSNNPNDTTVIKPFKFDVGNDDDIKSITDDIISEGRGIDIIISSAGAPIPLPTDPKYTFETVSTFLNVANFGSTKLLKGLFPIVNNYGRIVIISSNMANLNLIPDTSPKLIKLLLNENTTLDNLVDITKIYENDLKIKLNGQPEYSVELDDLFELKYPNWANEFSKILQVKLAKILNKMAKEKNGTDKEGIIVNACCPGWVETDMTRYICMYILYLFVSV